MNHAPHGLESPSLSRLPGRELAAYEIKFLLSELQAREVQERIGDRLVLDPHACTSNSPSPLAGEGWGGGARDNQLQSPHPNPPPRGGGNRCKIAHVDLGYAITSLYFDTAQYEVYHRLGQFKRRKHRLRRYAQVPWIFLERKSRWGDRVRKRRSMVPDADLARLAHAPADTNWPGHWFHRHLLRRGLVPVCRIAYDRVALVGHSPEGPLRLTFDRNIRGLITRAWDLGEVDAGHALLASQVVCEFKYRGFMPALFKEIVQAMQLTPCPLSKYRMFLGACL